MKLVCQALHLKVEYSSSRELLMRERNSFLHCNLEKEQKSKRAKEGNREKEGNFRISLSGRYNTKNETKSSWSRVCMYRTYCSG